MASLLVHSQRLTPDKRGEIVAQIRENPTIKHIKGAKNVMNLKYQMPTHIRVHSTLFSREAL